LHNAARRLFIQQLGTTYSADLGSPASSRLTLHFSAAVNPTIGTEPGKVSLVFKRDPVVNSGPAKVTFNDKTITGMDYDEANGSAELTVTGSVPLMASYSNNGRTITIAAVPSTVSTTATPAASPVQSPSPPMASSAISPPTNTNASVPPGRRFLVALDASHGGDERGAALAGNLLEKDLTLALARRIRQQLENRGIAALMVRDGDLTLTVDQRASTANAARVSLYCAVHAANEGTGVRIYTAALSNSGESRGPFLSWNLAQSNYVNGSQAIGSAVQAELAKNVAARLLPAPLRPLNNITAAAIAIEVSPRQPGNVADLTSPDYQEFVANAVANAVETAREKSGLH
jgi:N-acetylmuramoyl-L-alanine amidase